VVVGTGVRILVEVHEDILNLGLLRGVHYHNDWRGWGSVESLRVHCTWGRLVTDEFVACEVVVLCVGAAIVCVESLRGGASPGFLST
jgi:hypothetical protein